MAKEEKPRIPSDQFLIMAEKENFKKRSADFLERDFNQCFEQMRHYDRVGLNIFKFAISTYVSLGGAGAVILKWANDSGVDISWPIGIAFLATSLFGILLLVYLVRNRYYFVVTTRYVNEHRGFFLRSTPLGFENKVGMFFDLDTPKFFNWFSTHALLIYLMAFFNSALFSAGLILLTSSKPFLWLWIILFVVVFILQALGGVFYLASKESKKSRMPIS